jgi:hypothetical protein
MSTWCSGWNSHKTNRGHPRGLRWEPFRTSWMDIEGRCGWFQNGKRVPIWKGRGGFPPCPGSCLLPKLWSAHRKLLLSAFRQKSFPAVQAPAYPHAEKCVWDRPPKRKPAGWVETGQERSARRPLAAADLSWAQTLRPHPRWAGTATQSGRRVFYLQPTGSHATARSGCRKGD